MANGKYRKSKYTAAEKKAFRAGMAKQYNNEHPKFGFAAASKHTTYNEDGSIFGSPYHGKVMFFKTEKEAKDYVAANLQNLEHKEILEALLFSVQLIKSEKGLEGTQWTKPTCDFIKKEFEKMIVNGEY